MNTKKNKLSLRLRVAIPFLAFTFFWLVIGDLINYHQKAIYGFDLFGSQTPFTKPGKNDKGTVLLKTKNGKAAPGDSFSLTLHPFTVNHCSEKLVDFAKTTTVRYNFLCFYRQRAQQSVSLRGPPTA